MRAVMLDVPQAWLDERRSKGLDKRDELWEGELHMVPPPSERHQHVATQLLMVLVPLAEQRGLRATHETGVFRPGADDDYRVPDLVVSRIEDRSTRGVEGRAVLVVEVQSPGDETEQKLGFYADVGVEHVLTVDPDSRTVRLLRRAPDGMEPVVARSDEPVELEVLGLTMQTTDGPALQLRWPGGETTI